MQHVLCSKQVMGSQKITNGCFVCGTDNPLGLHAQFLNLENDTVCALFTAREAMAWVDDERTLPESIEV